MGDGYTYLGTILIGRSYENRRKCVTADIISAGTLTLTPWQDTYTSINVNFDYRKNGGSWSTTNNSAVGISVAVGDKVEVRLSSSSTWARNTAGVTLLSGSSNCRFKLSGNIMSLLAGEGFASLSMPIRCYRLFRNSVGLVSAEDLLMPSVVNSNDYEEMFKGCTSLTKAPELPATTLASYCYSSMFEGCTALTSAPKLPATTLASNCYEQMFYGCTSLNFIDAAFLTTPNASYTNNWVYNVSPTGLFIKNDTATWVVVGPNGVPTGWVVSGGTTAEEQAGTDFGGLTVAPGDLRYYSNTFQIMSNWSAYCSYNSTKGKVNGSTFFKQTELQTAGAISYGGYPDWRASDGEDLVWYATGRWCSRSEAGGSYPTDTYRQGATLYTSNGTIENAYSSWVFISGVTAMDGQTQFGRDWQMGLVIYPDNAIIIDGLGTIAGTHTTTKTALADCLVMSGPATIQPTGLAHLMDLGCQFLPVNGSNYTDTGGQYWVGNGLMWSTEIWEGPSDPYGTGIEASSYGDWCSRLNLNVSTYGVGYGYYGNSYGTCRAVRGSIKGGEGPEHGQEEES